MFWVVESGERRRDKSKIHPIRSRESRSPCYKLVFTGHFDGHGGSSGSEKECPTLIILITTMKHYTFFIDKNSDLSYNSYCVDFLSLLEPGLLYYVRN